MEMVLFTKSKSSPPSSSLVTKSSKESLIVLTSSCNFSMFSVAAETSSDKSGTYRPGVSPSSTSSLVNKDRAFPALLDT
jgi:hypothetical protein